MGGAAAPAPAKGRFVFHDFEPRADTLARIRKLRPDIDSHTQLELFRLHTFKRRVDDGDTEFMRWCLRAYGSGNAPSNGAAWGRVLDLSADCRRASERNDDPAIAIAVAKLGGWTRLGQMPRAAMLHLKSEFDRAYSEAHGRSYASR